MSSETPTSRMRTCFVRSLFEAARFTFILHISGPSTGLLSDDFMQASDRIVLMKFNNTPIKDRFFASPLSNWTVADFLPKHFLVYSKTAPQRRCCLLYWGWLWPRGRIQRKAVKNAASCGRMAESGHLMKIVRMLAACTITWYPFLRHRKLAFFLIGTSFRWWYPRLQTDALDLPERSGQRPRLNQSNMPWGW